MMKEYELHHENFKIYYVLEYVCCVTFSFVEI